MVRTSLRAASASGRRPSGLPLAFVLACVFMAPGSLAANCATNANTNLQTFITSPGAIGQIAVAWGTDTLGTAISTALSTTGAGTDNLVLTSSTSGCDVYTGTSLVLFYQTNAGTNAWTLVTKAAVTATTSPINPCTTATPTASTTPTGWLAQAAVFSAQRYSGATNGLDGTITWNNFAATPAQIGGTLTISCASLVPSPPPGVPAAPAAPVSPPPPIAFADPTILTASGNIQHRWFRMMTSSLVTSSSATVDLTDYGQYTTQAAGSMFLRASNQAVLPIALSSTSGTATSTANYNFGVRGNFSTRGALFPDTSKQYGAVLVWVGMPGTVTQAPPSGSPAATGTRTITLNNPSGPTNLFTFTPGSALGGLSLTIGMPTLTSPWGPLNLTLPGCPAVTLIAPPGMPHSSAPVVPTGRILYAVNVDNTEGIVVSVNGIPYGIPSFAACRFGNSGLLSNTRGILTFGTAATPRYTFLDFAVVQSSTAANVDVVAAAGVAAAALANASPPPPLANTGIVPIPISVCGLTTGTDLRYVTSATITPPFSGSMLFDTTQTSTTATSVNSAFFSSPAGLPSPAQPFLPSPGTVALGRVILPLTTAPSGAALGWTARFLVSGLPVAPSDFITLDLHNLIININSTFVTITNPLSAADSFIAAPLPASVSQQAQVAAYITIQAAASTSPVQVFVGKTKVTPTTYPAVSATAPQLGGIFATAYALPTTTVPAYLAFSGPSLFDIQIYGRAISNANIAGVATGNPGSC